MNAVFQLFSTLPSLFKSYLAVPDPRLVELARISVNPAIVSETSDAISSALATAGSLPTGAMISSLTKASSTLPSFAQFRRSLPSASDLASHPLVSHVSEQARELRLPEGAVDTAEQVQTSFFVAMKKMFREPPEKHEAPADFPASYFMKGLLEGVREKGNTRKLLRCIKNGRYVFGRILLAVDNIKKMDVPGVIRGLVIMAGAFREILNSIDRKVDGFDQLKKVAQTVMHIEMRELAIRAFLEGKEIMDDMTECMGAFDKGEYQKAGWAIGDAVYLLFLLEDFRVDLLME